MDTAKKSPYQLLSLYTGSMIELKERQDSREQGAYCIQIWREAFILHVGAYSCSAIDALRFFKLATLPCERKASRYMYTSNLIRALLGSSAQEDRMMAT